MIKFPKVKFLSDTGGGKGKRKGKDKCQKFIGSASTFVKEFNDF